AQIGSSVRVKGREEQPFAPVASVPIGTSMVLTAMSDCDRGAIGSEGRSARVLADGPRSDALEARWAHGVRRAQTAGPDWHESAWTGPARREYRNGLLRIRVRAALSRGAALDGGRRAERRHVGEGQ